MDNRGVYLDPWDACGSNRRINANLWQSHSRYRRKNDMSLPSVSRFFWRNFSGRTGNYIVAGTFVFVVFVSYFMTSVPTKETKELDCMRKFLKVMEVEVNRVEKSCMTTAKDVRDLREYSTRSMATETRPPIQYQKADAADMKHLPSTVLLDEYMSVLRKMTVPRQSSSKKEIAIMSYIYTNSFNNEKNESSVKK